MEIKTIHNCKDFAFYKLKHNYKSQNVSHVIYVLQLCTK